MEETYELSLDDLLYELEERGIVSTLLNWILLKRKTNCIMTLIKRMDEFIDKLEQNDKTFIETLNKNFEEYQKSKQKPSKKRR